MEKLECKNPLQSVTIRLDKFPTLLKYPFSLPLIQQTKALAFETPITVFVGENGTGKSTLLSAIARAAGIHIWDCSDGLRMEANKYEKALQTCLDLEWADNRVPGAYFSADIFKDFANILEQWAATDAGQLDYFGGKSLLAQSHGQSLMSYFKSRYGYPGLYFLDEPETALSPKTQLQLLDVISHSALTGTTQFLIATHSPILLSLPGAKIYSFDTSPVSQIGFHDTQHFKTYRDFIMNIKS